MTTTALSATPPFHMASAATTMIAESSSESTMSPLMQFFWESVISNGVPAFFTIVVIGFLAVVVGKSRNNNNGGRMGGMDDPALLSVNPVAALYMDLYGDQDQGKDKNPFGGGGFFGNNGNRKNKLPKNVGVPQQQFLQVTHLNRQYDSYDYSLALATQSKASAAATYRKVSFSRALEKALPSNLPASAYQELQQAEQTFLQKGNQVVTQLQQRQTETTRSVIDDELKKLGVKDVYALDPAVEDEPAEGNLTSTTNSTVSDSKAKASTTSSRGDKDGGAMKTANLIASLQNLELEFIRQVVRAVGPVHGPSVRAALLGDVAARGMGGLLLLALQDRPLTQLLSSSLSLSQADDEDTAEAPRRVFLTRFPGDTTASQVANLREEVTAIVRSAQPGDHALVVLQTGGGTVTGYGLAAAQLLRFKEAGLKLTIAVEQVAASGGYMMCCVADRIVASPFAVLGSIGVLTEIPNVYERLKKEGIEFQTVTAGKYKRTLTPTKKVTQVDFEKTKEDVEEILVLFRDFVAQNRPQLDIEQVATGETWFGTAALERQLCDEIQTVDNVIMEYMDQGANVYEVKYRPPPNVPALAGLFGNPDSTAQQSPDLSSSNNNNSNGPLATMVQRGIRWLVQTVWNEVRRESMTVSLDGGVEQRYRAESDVAERIKAE